MQPARTEAGQGREPGHARPNNGGVVSGQPCGRLRVHTEMVGSSPFTIVASRVLRLPATASEMRPTAC